MGKRRIAILTNHGLTFFLASGRQLNVEADFEGDVLRSGALQQYLQQISLSPLYLMLDLVEEEFRIEKIPHVGARDRDAVSRRKLHKAFPNATISQVRILERRVDGLRDDLVQFSAVAGVERLDYLLQTLEAFNIPLAAIFSLPLLLGGVVERVAGTESCSLVLSLIRGETSDSPLIRQSFFKKGRLLLSRVTRTGADPTNQDYGVLAEELERGRRFLVNQRVLQDKDPVHVHAWMDEAAEAAVREECHLPPQFDFAVDGVADVARRIGPATTASGIAAGWIGARMIARMYWPRSHYRRHAALAAWQWRRLNNGLIGGVASVLLLGLAVVGYQLQLAEEAIETQSSLAREIASLKRQVDGLDVDVPHYAVPATQLRDAVLVAGEWRKKRIDLSRLLDIVSHGLNGYPGVVLDRLVWGDKVNDGRAGSAAPAPAGPDGAGDDLPLDEPPLEPGAEESQDVVLELRIKGHLKGFDENLRGGLDRIRAFADALSQQPGVEKVELLKLPLDVTPGANVSGEVVAMKQEDVVKPVFELGFAIRVGRDENQG